jgi:hypothetical protein
MKRVLTVLLAACAVLMFAACGGGNNATNAGNTKANDGHDHDEHGEVHDMGEKDLGDGYKVKVGHVEAEGTSEAVFEVDVQSGVAAVKDATVSVWIGDAAGKELSPVGTGEWMADENLYDCHVAMPKDAKDAKLWVRVRHGGKDMKTSYDIPKD